MSTQIATAMAGGNSPEAAITLIKELQQQLKGEKPKLVLVFASTTQPLETLMPPLCAAFGDAVALGASTAGEFTERGDHKGQAAVFALCGDFSVSAGMGTGIKADAEAAVKLAAAALKAPTKAHPHRTGLLLLDPLSGVSEEITLHTAVALGESVPLAGGAAGDDLKMTRTTVALGTRVCNDAVVLAVLDGVTPLGLGVEHGHLPLSQTYKVTKADGATVMTLDGRPAWDVWSDATRADAAKRGLDPATLKPEGVTPYLLLYEAGLDTGDGSLKIRAPLSKTPQGAINFACAIPEGATIRITQSAPNRQVDSARSAARKARAGLKGAAPAGGLVFDCICRNLILGDGFGAAVAAIHQELGSVPLAGFETYGEVALAAGDMSGFHNTTTVVLAFPR